MSTLELNELQQEVLTELLNVSVGKAANVLSQMVFSEIGMSIPTLKQIPQRQLADQLQSEIGQQITTVTMTTEGALSGSAILSLSMQSSFNLVYALLQGQVSREALTELEEEALTEMGNVVLNACMATFADQLEERIHTSIPYCSKGTPHQLIGEEEHEVLYITINLTHNGGKEHGTIILMLHIESAQNIRALIDNYLEKMV